MKSKKNVTVDSSSCRLLYSALVHSVARFFKVADTGQLLLTGNGTW